MTYNKAFPFPALYTIIFSTIALVNNAHAWNGVGHRAIAKLAWSHMTPDARDMTFKLLTSGIDIPETTDCHEQFVVSQTTDKAAAFVRSVSWLDCSRGQRTKFDPLPYSALVHADRRSFCPTINNGSTAYCRSAQCASKALTQAIKDLNNPWATVKTRRVATKIIMHLLTDLHQPLHAGYTGKGISVRADEKSEALDFHAYWDSVVPQLVLANKDQFTSLAKTNSEKFKTGTLEDWVQESTKRASQTFGDLLGEANKCSYTPKSVVTIPSDYTQKTTELGRTSMAAGAVRLAYIFNEAAKNLAPYRDYIDRSITMSKLLRDAGTSEERTREIDRILTTAGIDHTMVKPLDEHEDVLEEGDDALSPGQGIYPGQSLLSTNQGYELIMQMDNNLVLYKLLAAGKRALWASNTVGSGAVEAILQKDGNFVLYNQAHRPVWASNTLRQKKAAKAILQDDGNFVLYDENNKPVWATNTWGK